MLTVTAMIIGVKGSPAPVRQKARVDAHRPGGRQVTGLMSEAPLMAGRKLFGPS